MEALSKSKSQFTYIRKENYVIQQLIYRAPSVNYIVRVFDLRHQKEYWKPHRK